MKCFIAVRCCSLCLTTAAFWLAPGLAFWLAAQEPVEPRDTNYIVGGQLFDSESGEFKVNPGIAIKDGKFVLPGEDEGDRQVLELGDDDYILPGLVDLHAHYNVKLFNRRREEFNVLSLIHI